MRVVIFADRNQCTVFAQPPCTLALTFKTCYFRCPWLMLCVHPSALSHRHLNKMRVVIFADRSQSTAIARSPFTFVLKRNTDVGFVGFDLTT